MHNVDFIWISRIILFFGNLPEDQKIIINNINDRLCNKILIKPYVCAVWHVLILKSKIWKSRIYMYMYIILHLLYIDLLSLYLNEYFTLCHCSIIEYMYRSNRYVAYTLVRWFCNIQIRSSLWCIIYPWYSFCDLEKIHKTWQRVTKSKEMFTFSYFSLFSN